MKVSQRIQASALEEVNLANEGIGLEPKTILIAKEMLSSDKERLIVLLKQYKDLFSWSFEDMKGLDPAFCQHQINLHKDAKLVQRRRHRLNQNYAVKLKEEINKLLRVEFIRSVKKAMWLIPIVVVPKKKRKMQVSVDYRKLKAATITDAFPIPFTNKVLDAVAGHEIYSFLDGFSGYNQVRMHPDDKVEHLVVHTRCKTVQHSTRSLFPCREVLVCRLRCYLIRSFHKALVSMPQKILVHFIRPRCIVAPIKPFYGNQTCHTSVHLWFSSILTGC